MADQSIDVGRGDRANYLPAPASFLLNHSCSMVNQALGGFGCYLVGSSLVRRDYRDVDVRLIMDDESFDRLFPGAAQNPPLCAMWSLMCASIALLLSQRTGLPVDFQIQRQTEANAKFAGPRSALGIFLGYPGGG